MSQFDNSSGVFIIPSVAERLKDKGRAWLIGFFVVFTLVGNVLTFAVLLLRMVKRARAMSILLMSLAVADICTAVFIEIPAVLFYAHGTYLAGNDMCKIHRMVSVLFINASSLTHLLIAIERYRSLRRMNTSSTKMKPTYISIAAVWMYNLAFGIPYAFLHSVEPKGDAFICSYDYTARNGDYGELVAAHGYIAEVGNFFIPFGLMVFCYLGVIIQMRQSTRRIAATQKLSENKVKRTRTVTTMCIVVVALFSIRSVPFMISSNILLHNRTDGNQKRFENLLAVNFGMNCLNPVIYGILWNAFRQHALSLFCPCCFECKTPLESTVSRQTADRPQINTRTTLAVREQPQTEIFTTSETISDCRTDREI